MPGPANMWSYWRDKYGVERALDDYYSDLIARNPLLAVAKVQIEIAKRAIESEMKRLADEEEEFD